MLNNNTGVVVPDLYPSTFSGSLFLNGANFGMDAPFKPDYSHQPLHGAKPFAGILLHDAVLNIGSNAYSKNKFFNMNNGIRAYRSIMKVYNSNFTDIQLVPFYNNGSNQNGSAISIVGDNESEMAAPSSLALWPNPDGSPNVARSRCEVYAAITYTEIFGCLFDTLDYGIDEQFLDIGLQSYLLYNTIRAKRYGIRLMENNGSDNISVEGNSITMLNLEKSAVGIYMGESNLHHSNNYNVNSNGVYIYNATAGIQTAGVSKATITYNTVELRTPLSYTAPSTTGIDIGGGAGNFLSCNHVSGHQVTDTLRYGYRVTQSPFDSLKCNVADSVGYSFRFEGAACVGTRLKGNYMGNAYCGLYLNTESIIGQQPQLANPLPTYHGNVWLNSSRYTSGFGAVNLNDASPLTLISSLLITDQNITFHNPIVPLDSTLGPFHVDDNGWFFPQISGASFDCSRSNVCIAAVQDSGDWGDDQLRMRVINDSSVSSLFIPESKQIASQLIYADLKTDPNARSVNAYSDFLIEKENSSEGIIYQIDSIGSEIRTSILDRNDEVSGLVEQQRILSDSILLIDSIFTITKDTGLFQQKDNLLFQISENKADINEIEENYSLTLSSKQTTKEQLNILISPHQIPDANIAEAERINLLYKQNGVSSILNNYESLFQIAIQCPSAGGPAVFVARNLIKLVNDSIVYDDANICMQLGILRVANQQHSGKTELAFTLQPNPANYVVHVVLDNNEMKTYQLQIFNSLGQDVFNEEYANIFSTIQFSVTTLKEGLYTVVVRESNGQQKAQKLVIVR
ncbi:MAG: T9SS type A sorting domain-containing protein [Bacteroidia bacterium]|nr:T9SS type A sorting domain-containing protein [Bacteroidia bacterium]